MKRQRTQKRQTRKGTITVLAAIMSIVLVGMVAFCVDVGFVLSAKEELQRATDSSALAACWEFGRQMGKGATPTAAADAARAVAVQYAALNRVTGDPMTVNPNTANSPNGDIVLGYISDFKNPNAAFVTDSPNGYNAVKV